MKIGLLTFEQFHGRKNLGSSRIRGHWLLNHWPEAELFKQGQKYDAVIYQKAYFLEHAKIFNGVKILDICDPDWLHWSYKVKEMIDNVDAITTSTEALAISLKQLTDKPVVCIPDRVDLNEFKNKKVHEEDAKTVAWYGYSDNYDMLKPVVSVLKNNNLDLIVISDGHFQVPGFYQNHITVTNYKWNIKTVDNDIMLADFVVNPQGLNGKWKFKSNNKTLTAWALGMPVARTDIELKKFIKCDERIKEVEKRTKELEEKWDVKLSVQEMKNIIEKCKETK